MAKHTSKALVLLTVLFVLAGLAAQTVAYVPDGLVVSEQPETIDADGQSTTSITVQLMADLDGNFHSTPVYEDVVKKCGVEVICESQDPDVLEVGSTAGTNHVKVSSSTVKGWTDEFGKVKFTFKSTGSEAYNEGDPEVICRSLQLKEGKSTVHVHTNAATHFHVTQCPKSDAANVFTNPIQEQLADILADGSSKVLITAQLKNKNQNPVHKVGKVRFKSMKTVIVKTCGPTNGINAAGYYQHIIDTGQVEVTTDAYGVATAQFCSAGSGQENEGPATIHIESIDFPNVAYNTTTVTTTSQFGTTYKNGYIALSSMADQIMADNESCVKICAQARDQDYRIIKKSGWQILLESEDTSLLVANPWASETDHGLAFATTNSEGVAEYKYCSVGKFDNWPNPGNNVGKAKVRASAATVVQEASTYVDLRTEQIWPVAVEAKATMPQVDCDGVSTVTITAQLLDRYRLATKFGNRLVTFESQDISKLKNPTTGSSVVDVLTDAYGKAKATFVTTDCKFGGHESDVVIKVTTQSPVAQNTTTVKVIKPLGFVPDAVSVYSDQGLRGMTEAQPAHAKPFLISADGMKKTYVTAQICEWVYEAGHDGDPAYRKYCNPVKRHNVEIEFKVIDNNVVQNKGTDNPNPSRENGVDYVKLYTDDEGQATAVFRSTGDAPVNKNKCTLIKIDAKNGAYLGTAYAQVCAKGKEGTNANAIWIWADPAIISADGTSHTTIRGALYYCEGLTYHTPKDPRQMTQVADYNYLNESCKPAQLAGVTVKFETMNTDALDDGMGGYKIYDVTDAFGQAHATFQSKGSDTQHITGATGAEIQAWTIGSGEDIKQLNLLQVRTEEKTWPWCPALDDWFAAGSPEATADQDHDQFLTDNELIEYIVNVWMRPFNSINNRYGNDDAALIQVILAWLDQL